MPFSLILSAPKPATGWRLPQGLCLAAMLALAGCAAQPETRQTGQCFGPDDVRLWQGAAPGALGADPCRDVPFVRVVPAAPGRNRGTAIVLMPGGGYDRLSDEAEQAPVAAHFASLGITTFILHYRLAAAGYAYPIPFWDGRRALALVRGEAARWGVDPARIGVFGFSAGGHLAAVLSLRPLTDFLPPVPDALDGAAAPPAFLGLGYPVVSMQPSQAASRPSHDHLLAGYGGPELHRLEQGLSVQYLPHPGGPPVFLFDSLDDRRVDPRNSLMLVAALQAAGEPVESLIVPQGRHGAGLATDQPEERDWPRRFEAWLAAMGE